MVFYQPLVQCPPCCCYKLTDTHPGRHILLHFCKCERQIQLSFEDVLLCMVNMQAAHLWVIQLTEIMQQGIL